MSVCFVVVVCVCVCGVGVLLEGAFIRTFTVSIIVKNHCKKNGSHGLLCKLPKCRQVFKHIYNSSKLLDLLHVQLKTLIYHKINLEILKILRN